MKHFLLFMAALAVSGSLGAQTEDNLDFHLGTPVMPGVCTYAKDTTANHTQHSQMTHVDGWTYGVENGDARAGGLYRYGSGAWLGGPKFIVPDADASGNTDDNALGVVAVWTGTVQYTDTVTLPAGHYKLTIPVYNAGGTTRPVKSLIGFITADGKEFLASAKVYETGAWTTEIISIALDSTTKGCFSLGYQAPNSGSDANLHLFFDEVKVDTILEVDVARTELEAALNEANMTLEDVDNVGKDLFMISEDAYNAFADAVAQAQNVFDNPDASAEDLRTAILRLSAAAEAYAQLPLNEPKEGTMYTFTQRGNNLYLALNPVETTEAGNDDAVALSATPYPFTFEKTDGGWYLTDTASVHQNYLGAKGTNAWTMSATADNRVACTFTRLSDGFYTINMTGYQSVGTDAVTPGSQAWADKSMTRNGYDNTMCQWAIATYTAPVPDAIEKVTTKADLNGNVYTISGQLVGRNGSLNGLRKGIYIVDGKKVVK